MSNYTGNQYTTDANNSWSMAFDFVNDYETVLDIGCSSGNFGAKLIKQKKCVVDGIDIDDQDIKIAKQHLRKAEVLNIETDSLKHFNEKYDTVLMLDVIEHLVFPVQTLTKIAKLLKPKGKLIFSVPNMAHISVRLDLILGDLEYRNTGLLDDTHLHFYTEKTLLYTLNKAGFMVNKSQSTTISYPQQLINLKLKQAGLSAKPEFTKLIERTKGNVYQFVGTATLTPSEKKKPSFPTKNPHEYHFKEIERTIQDQNQQIKNIEAELRVKEQYIKNIDARLNRIVQSPAYKLARVSFKPIAKAKSMVRKKEH